MKLFPWPGFHYYVPKEVLGAAKLAHTHTPQSKIVVVILIIIIIKEGKTYRNENKNIKKTLRRRDYHPNSYLGKGHLYGLLKEKAVCQYFKNPLNQKKQVLSNTVSVPN